MHSDESSEIEPRNAFDDIMTSLVREGSPAEKVARVATKLIAIQSVLSTAAVHQVRFQVGVEQPSGQP